MNKPCEDGEDGSYSTEVGDPTENETKLQIDLGGFALDLLEENPSWSKQVTIQNLVIWEPTEPEPPELSKKKKAKKSRRAKKSGLDFSNQKRKSRSVNNISRAGSPASGEVTEVVYSLDNVKTESNRWVVDKNAGETILHRASKMGYPDVVAYSLDMLGTDPMEKDYAGMTPLHKAAFKGHEMVVRVLLNYGADPGAGVKGTRALHEAIEGGSTSTVHRLLSYGADPLLHDYSGKMPLDLSANDLRMRRYLTNLLADLHGKVPVAVRGSRPVAPITAQRWNVSHDLDFHQPPACLPSLEQELAESRPTAGETFSFEMSAAPLPPTYQLRDRAGQWVLYRDMKDYTKKYCSSRVDVRTKGKLIELKKSEFLRNSHCSLLDRRSTEVRFHEREEEDIVILVKVDNYVRNIFNTEIVDVGK